MYRLNLAIVNGEVVFVDEEAIQEQRRKEARKKAARQIQDQMSFILFQDIDPKQDFEELIGSYATIDYDKIKGFNSRKLAAEIAPKAPCMVFVNIDGEKKLLTQYSGKRTRPVVINCQLKTVSNYYLDGDEIFGRFDDASYWGCYSLDEEEIEAQAKEVGDYTFKFRGYRRKGGNCGCYDNKHGDACCKQCTWYDWVQKRNQAAKKGKYWTDYYITS